MKELSATSVNKLFLGVYGDVISLYAPRISPVNFTVADDF